VPTQLNVTDFNWGTDKIEMNIAGPVGKDIIKAN
jgi:hypothetical protein